MKFMSRHFVAAAMASVLVMGCSSSDEDEALAIAELVDFEQKFEATEVWDRSIGDGTEGYFSTLQPVINKGVMYTASRDGQAAAFSLDKGKLLWEVDLSDIEDVRSFYEARVSAQVSGGVSYAYGKVYMGTEHGDVFALDAETGALAWRTTVKGEVLAKPQTDSGLLVLNTTSGSVIALNVDNGEEVWSTELDVPPLTLRGISGLEINSGGVILGNASGEVTVLILDSGQQGWTTEIGEPSGITELERIVDVDTTPIAFGDKIYAISSKGNLAALDLRSGRILWKRQYSSYRELTVAGNTIYTTDVKGHVYAIERNNGMEKWVNSALTNRGVTGAVAIGNYVVVGDAEGYLHWLDRDTGEFVSRLDLGGEGIYIEPIVEDSMLYVQTRDGSIFAISTPE